MKKGTGKPLNARSKSHHPIHGKQSSEELTKPKKTILKYPCLEHV